MPGRGERATDSDRVIILITLITLEDSPPFPAAWGTSPPLLPFLLRPGPARPPSPPFPSSCPGPSRNSQNWREEEQNLSLDEGRTSREQGGLPVTVSQAVCAWAVWWGREPRWFSDGHMCQAREQPRVASSPWRSYHLSPPGRSLCSGRRKGHLEGSPLLRLLAPSCLSQGGSPGKGAGGGSGRGWKGWLSAGMVALAEEWGYAG